VLPSQTPLVNVDIALLDQVLDGADAALPQAASTQLETLNNTLKTFTLRSDLRAEQLAAVAKTTSNALCHMANLLPVTDGGVLDAWKRSKQQLAVDGSATPNDKKREREADQLGEASRANSGETFPPKQSRQDGRTRSPLTWRRPSSSDSRPARRARSLTSTTAPSWERCRELVRLMVLEGFISADTFVSATAEELEAQLDAFRKKLG